PSPIVKSYLGLAQYLGSQNKDLSLKLFVTEHDRRGAVEVFVKAGLEAGLERPASAGRPPLVMLNPGAQYGAAKCWLPEYFAAVGDRLVEDLGATVLISSAPKERRIVEAIARQMKHAAVDLAGCGATLGALKEIVRRCDLMVT